MKTSDVSKRTALAVSFVLISIFASIGMAVAQDDQAFPRRLAGHALDSKTRELARGLGAYSGTPFSIGKWEPPGNVGYLEFFPAPLEFPSDILSKMSRDLAQTAHWKYEPRRCLPMTPRSGVVLLTRIHPDRTLDAREWRAYEAAQQLRCYLFAQLGVWPALQKATVLPECPGLPPDGVLIEIGSDPPENDRLPRISDRGFERCADELQGIAGQ